MPVARIISSSFEDALKFADYLRPLFDTVEIAQPGRAYTTAVDLEVNLELCTPEQAWQQIAQAGGQPQTEVFVAPGTLFAEDAQPQEAEEIQPAAGGAQQELEDTNRDLDAAIAHASAAAVVAAGSNGSGTHKPDHAGAVPEQELNWLGRVRESMRQRLAIRALLREIREMEEQKHAAERQRQRQMALQFERERREKEMQQFVPAPLVEQRPAALQEMEQRQEIAEPLSSLEQEETVRRQAEEEEAIRRGIFVEQILSRRAQEQAAGAPVEGVPEAEAVPVEFQAVPTESFLEPQFTAPVRIFRRGPGSRLRPAMALAGVTSVLLTAVLVGYAHRRPASPLPVSALQRSEVVKQTVPFGAAVVPSPDPAPETEPAAAPVETASVSAPPERHDFRDDFHRVRVGSHEVDYVSGDVTVRHFIYKRPGTLLPPSASAVHVTTRDGVKQISDLQ